MIPESALKKHIAILGMNGSGKTSVAKSQVIEPALAAGERVCNVDPTGVGWGLRLSASGNAKGFSIYIVGGGHADFPLFRRDGKAWAEIVGTSSDSFVFDTSQMTVSDRSAWFTDFAETLLRLNKGPLKLVLDEAHLFAPQGGAKAGGSAPAMLHATNNLLALGRSRGLRITMISQRPAKLHKDSLTQAHTLIAMSLIAPHDRDAVSAWIADQADSVRGKEIIASLPKLDPGEGWIWAPKEGVLERVRFPRPRTFDSSSAPDDGDSEGPTLSPINPDVIKAKLAVVAKETVANDPKALRAEILRLKAELAKTPSAPTVTPEDLRREFHRGELAGNANGYQTGFRDGVAAAVKAANAVPLPSKPVAVPAAPARAVAPVAAQRPIYRPREVGANGSLPKAERLILTVLAQRQPERVATGRIAAIAGYSAGGGSFNNAVSALRTKGYIEPGPSPLAITQAGIDALGDYEPLPTGRELLAYWTHRLPKAERAILDVLGDSGEASKTDIADRAGYAPDGGGFNNALSALRTLGLITGSGTLSLHEDLRG
jgi:hypothetical protein